GSTTSLEAYLWYDEIVDVDRAPYANAPDYFNALLVRTPDATGQRRDRFSAALPAAVATDLLEPVHAAPATPVPGNLLTAPSDSVPAATVATSPQGRRTGYIRFNDFSAGTQDDMIAAFRALRGEGVRDLVLDLRANSGGFLYVALAVASMVAGPAAEDKVFERLRYNDKRDDLTAASTLRYASRLQFEEDANPKGTRLPQLDLPRLYVLSSNLTCSASESVINGLRGIDIDVIIVGDTTCGKPYGFTRRDNCGYAYFPIEFQGANAKGFGGYVSGFQPTCRVADDGDAVPGSATDPLLKAALHHADTGSCPADSASARRSSVPAATPSVPVRPVCRAAAGVRVVQRGLQQRVGGAARDRVAVIGHAA
ncbi:MAG: hypothetical protein EOO24_60340, partial [Comamonadaceae bacterium]